jgi:hypothetical protein
LTKPLLFVIIININSFQKGKENKMHLDFSDWFALTTTVLSIGLLIHLVLDAHGAFDERRKKREEEKKKRKGD